MSLPGTVVSAPNGSQGFDTDTVVTAAVALEFYNSGYIFCIRYLSLGSGQASGDLSTTEANHILSAGLGLMAVQHVRSSGWSPTGALGTTDGTNAGSNASAVGFPSGVNIWCDLEGVLAGTTAANVIAYCNNWYTAVHAAGYVPGIYVGANAILTGAQLYSDLDFQHYWKSLSSVPAIPTRGYQMTQTAVSGTVHGISIDADTTEADMEGGKALWLQT